MKKLVVVVLTSIAVAAAWAAAGNRPVRHFEQTDDAAGAPGRRASPAPLQPRPSVDTHFADATKLVADDGMPMDGFGSSVSLDGQTVVVGAQFHAAAGTASGAAYVFDRDDSGWAQGAKLIPGDAAPFDFFGISVSLFADRALIGSWQDDDNGMESGSAYVFERTETAGVDWAETAKLTASDGTAGDVFGSAVVLEGDVTVVGAPLADAAAQDSGAAYVFRFDGTTWNEEAKLTASDAQSGDTFGDSVAVSGDVVVVGASRDDDNDQDSGAAYVFAYDGTDWSEQAKLTASDGEAGRRFGLSVSVDGQTVVVGSEFAADGGVYVFGPDGGGWVEQQKLTVTDGIGFAVSVAGPTLVGGAYLDDEAAAGAGAAYVFGLSGTTWAEDQKLIADDAAADDRFGFAVSTDGSGVAVGADLDDDNGMDAGAIYVYESGIAPQPPTADAGTDSLDECVTVEGAMVRLDGSGSTDPNASSDGTGGADGNGGIVLYEWFEDFGATSETFLGDGEVIDVELPLGEHAITLRVENSVGLDDTDDVMAAVVDTTAPEISVELSPAVLWPPNHRLIPVVATVEATDACGAPDVVLDSVNSSEPDNAPGGGDGNTVDDIRGAKPGTADFKFYLRAERAGSGPGRAYVVRYTAADSSGNDASAGAEVRVPHSQGGGGGDRQKAERSSRERGEK